MIVVDYLKIKQVYNDELYHHGVKGQRWGVRNEKDKPTGKQRVKRAAIGGAIGLGAAASLSPVTKLGTLIYAGSKESIKGPDAIDIYNKIGNKVLLSVLAAGTLTGITIGALKKNNKKQKNSDR